MLQERVNDLNYVNDKLYSALSDLMECPYVIDQATIPNAGIDAAPDQVVGNMSVALVKRRAALAAIKLHRDRS